MEINANVVESKRFVRFLEDERNNIAYLKYMYEPSEKNAMELNEAYKKFERQLMARAYLKKAIYYESKKFDETLRNNERQKISIDKHDEATLGNLLIDKKSEEIHDEIWDSTLEEIFTDIKLHQAIINLTLKQRNVLYLLYIMELNEKEVAGQMNVTQQAISKTHRTAINKLKKVIFN